MTFPQSPMSVWLKLLRFMQNTTSMIEWNIWLVFNNGRQDRVVKLFGVGTIKSIQLNLFCVRRNFRVCSTLFMLPMTHFLPYWKYGLPPSFNVLENIPVLYDCIFRISVISKWSPTFISVFFFELVSFKDCINPLSASVVLI